MSSAPEPQPSRRNSLLNNPAIASLIAVIATLGVVTTVVIGSQTAQATSSTTSSTTQSTGSFPVLSRSAARAAYTLPPVNGKADYQLGGAYKPPAGVKIVSRDRTAKPAKGKYNICYVNAFQAQPGETGWWKRKHPELLLRDGAGDYVVDEGWDELILDISTPAKRKRIAAIVGGWFTGCAKKGYRAVEPDNLDSYTRSQNLLTKADALALTRLLARRAHAAGLAIAQKNTVELGRQGRKAGLDFAVTEDCGQYDECGGYTKVYGRHVIVIEYTKKAFAQTCEEYGSKLSVVRRDRDVSPRGSDAYVYRAC